MQQSLTFNSIPVLVLSVICECQSVDVSQDPKKASEVIVQRAREAWSKERCGYRDDITAVVVRLE